MPEIISKDFIFNNHAGELYLLAVDIIDHVKETGISENTESKLKMILIELLTNSLKHAKHNQTLINVTLNGDEITLKKMDGGNPLCLASAEGLLEWPLPGRHHTGKVIPVYADIDSVLKCRLHDNCRVAFFIEETELTNAADSDINNLTEHFGLMIITRACGLFEYEFNIENCTNNFIVTLTKGQ